MRGEEEAFAGTSRFVLRERLGGGGGGVVYRAFDRARGGDVAIKVMRDSEGDGMARFRAVFAALRELSHPNLVQLLDLVDEHDRTLLVMELVEGVELYEHVCFSGGGFDELRLRHTFGQLGQALRALHRQRKVHRDVKPHNVRVTAEGRAVLLDLDLLFDLDSEPSRHELEHGTRPVGTALYMAPEQAASHRVHPGCDWYSVGVMLYEALTGVLPYRGSDLEVLLKKQDGPPARPSSLLPGIPADLDALCADLVRPNPSERPSGAEVLRRLGVHEELLSGRLSLASLLSQRPPFIGRGHELDRLMASLERSRREPVVVRVTGDPGTGKTMLCEEFLQKLAHKERRALSLASSCPRYPDRPHAPLHEPFARITEALRNERAASKLPVSPSVLRLLERAFPGAVIGLEAHKQGRTASAPDPLEQRFRTVAALRAIVSEVAALRPLVLWIDNYHWADVDTQRLISALVQGPDAPRMLLLLSEESEPGLPHVSQPPAQELIALTPLTRVESRELAETLLERATGSMELEPVYFRNGSPLLIQERIRYALFFGEAPREDEGVAQLVGRRVAALGPETLRVLKLICAAHDPVLQEVCERASELSRAEFSRQLSALRVGGLVRTLAMAGEDYVVAQHPLVAESVELELTPEERAYMHGRLSVALVARDPARASGRLLRHQGESGDHLRAAESARVAAEQAHEALAFQRAAELYTLCTSLDPPGHDEAGYLLLRRMADALVHAGWALSAANIYRDAALSANAAEALHMRQRAASQLLRGAEVDEGVEAIRELLASIDLTLPRTPRRLLWSVMGERMKLHLRGLRFREVAEGQLSARELRRVDVLWSCGMQLSLVDAARGSHFLARGLSEALKAGEPQRVARALCTEAWTLVGLSNDGGKRSHDILESARALIERLNSPLLDGHLRLSQGMVAFGTYRLPECSTHCRDAERVFRDHCQDAVWEVTTAQTYQLVALSLMARYHELSVKLTHCLRESEERGDIWGYTGFQSIGALSVKLAKNLPNEAAEDVREAISRWSSEGRDFHSQHFLGLMASVYIDLYRGNDAALDQLEGAWDALKRKHFLRANFMRVPLRELRGRAALLAARKRKDPTLLKLAEAEARQLLHEQGAVAHAFGLTLRANVWMMRGAPERAVDALSRAKLAFESHGLELWLPPVRAALAELTGKGDGHEREHALHEMQKRGVVDAERFLAMHMPAFAHV
jgi:serine/threonine protein kinase